MRTDSCNVSKQAQAEAVAFIQRQYGEKYIPETPRIYKTKVKGAQEAHEAIRPAHPEETPESLKAGGEIDARGFKLYDLIWRRFIASQMKEALFDATAVDVLAKNYTFRATGQTLKFDGFLKSVELNALTNEQKKAFDSLPTNPKFFYACMSKIFYLMQVAYDDHTKKIVLVDSIAKLEDI